MKGYKAWIKAKIGFELPEKDRVYPANNKGALQR
jgi:hypothetical protein